MAQEIAETPVLRGKDAKRFREAIQNVKPISEKLFNGIVPQGYMTIEEFRTEAQTSLTKILNEHGIY
jgi:hypothetical protein